MVRIMPTPLAKSSPEPRLLTLLLLCVGSGAAALVYELVWFQLLQLFVGSSAVSLGVLLGTFMGECAWEVCFFHASFRPGIIRCECSRCSSSASV